MKGHIMILNKENNFTENNRFLVYSNQLNATRKQILDETEEMISRSAIQTFEDEGETITANDASYLASLTVDGKAVQDGTPTPSNPVPVEVVEPVNGVFGINVNDVVTPIDLQGNVLASLPDGTKDVLTVDSTGAVTLEKRVRVFEVGSADVAGIGTSAGNQYVSVDISDTPNRGINSTATERYIILSNRGVAALNANTVGNTYITGNGSVIILVFTNGTFADKAAAQAWVVANSTIFAYKLATPQTVDLGYIDMPAIPDGAEISIVAQVTPAIAAKWWTKNQSDVAAAFGAVSSDLAALDARVAALESANAKSLVLEKPETVKETIDMQEEIEEQEEQEEQGEQEEQEEMPFEDAEE